MFNGTLNKYNSAEKGLEEALDQVDKLKEDMTNLCDDIDFLYKKQIVSDCNEDIKKNYYTFNDGLCSNFDYNNIKNEMMDWSMNEDTCDEDELKRETKNSLNTKILNKKPHKNKCIVCLNKKSLKKSYSLITSLQSVNKLILQSRKTRKITNSIKYFNYKQAHLKNDKYCCYGCKKKFYFN